MSSHRMKIEHIAGENYFNSGPVLSLSIHSFLKNGVKTVYTFKQNLMMYSLSSNLTSVLLSTQLCSYSFPIKPKVMPRYHSMGLPFTNSYLAVVSKAWFYPPVSALSYLAFLTSANCCYVTNMSAVAVVDKNHLFLRYLQN